MDQLKRIMFRLGTPTDADWPGYRALSAYSQTEPGGDEGQRWTHMLMSVGKSGVELIKEMFRYDPQKRITAKQVRVSPQHIAASDWTDRWVTNPQALQHQFFYDDPRPTAPINLPKSAKVLQPRPLPPDELNGQPLLPTKGGGMKRKAEEPSGRDGGSDSELSGKKVARKLF